VVESLPIIESLGYNNRRATAFPPILLVEQTGQKSYGSTALSYSIEIAGDFLKYEKSSKLKENNKVASKVRLNPLILGRSGKEHRNE
jgi:hypothetical protein